MKPLLRLTFAIFLSVFFLTKIYGQSTTTTVNYDSTSQDFRLKNYLSMSFLGDASLIALNYERQFLMSSDNFLSSNFGIGYNREFILICWPSPCPVLRDFLTISHHLKTNIGKGNNFFEFGFGGTLLVGAYGKTKSFLAYPIIGYKRYSSEAKKISLRIFLSFPIYRLNTTGIIYSPVGVSLGKTF